jgi:hypothetical protein
MSDSLIAEIATNLGVEGSEVASIIDEFLLQLNRRAFEYVGSNGDFIGEELHYEIPPQAFYHLLMFLDWFSDAYGWEAGDSLEYLLRLGQRSNWVPFRHQMDGWKPGRSAG